MSGTPVLVKQPYKKESYTDRQIAEIVKAATDPVYFISEYMWIQHPTKGRVKFELYDYQVDLINCYHQNRYSINMLGRQMGKSTCAAGYLLWYAMFVPDSTILIAAHKYTGSQEIMQRVRFMYENLPEWIKAGATSYNKGSIDFDNGSRIVSATTTENTGRGMSITLVYLDEFAFVPPRIAKEFWTALSPTLATGGKCIITSTPNQDNDQFAQIWNEANKKVDAYGNEQKVGKNGFASIMYIWRDHPDRDHAWGETERSKIGEERFLREHECVFITADETLVNSMMLTNLEIMEPLKKVGQLRVFTPIEKEFTYVVSWDPSLGTGSDPAAIEVFRLPDLQQVAEWQHNKTDVRGQLRMLVTILDYIKESGIESDSLYWSVENNTLGEAALVAITEYGEERIPGYFLSEPGAKRRGFNTTNKSKLAACTKLKYYIESGKMVPKSKNLIQELKTFVAHGASFAAKEGETDDLVMATLLAVRVIEHLMKYDEKTYARLVERHSDDFVAPMPIGIL
jgi:Terminase large subunit, T4likevirus-type, N-terminal/Terminase RNaseH-like domain